MLQDKVWNILYLDIKYDDNRQETKKNKGGSKNKKSVEGQQRVTS